MLFSDTPYDAVNRNVLSLRLNSAVDWRSFNSVGSWFHRRGAATEKSTFSDFQSWPPDSEIAVSWRTECRSISREIPAVLPSGFLLCYW